MKTQTAESPHLTVAQLAARWHTTANAIYLMRHKGTGPAAIKRGTRVLFPLAEVKKAEQAMREADAKWIAERDPSNVPVRTRRSRKPAPAAP